MPTARITRSGRDWTQPSATISMQRERADPPLLPIAAEFSGPWRYGSWAACFAVVTLLICAVLS